MDVVVIGAGIAGLYCASLLEKAGLNVLLLEAADAPGGRIRTDVVDGFRLDRGFQVLLTAYPEAERALSYPSLKLCDMKPGALVQREGKVHRFADPFREPMAALKLLFDPVVTLSDKLLVARLRERTMRGQWQDLFAGHENSTLDYLSAFGFSPSIIEAFFRPFFSGVFLERELKTSSRYFEFLFRMFASGPVAVPEQGMGAIPRQMAENLKPGTLLTRTRVSNVVSAPGGFAVAATGMREVSARAVVIAAGEQSRSLLNTDSAGNRWNCTTTYYFAAEKPPLDEPILMLNGDTRKGPLNHLAVMSQVSRHYAPPGAELICANVVGEAPTSPGPLKALEEQVREQCRGWFGDQVGKWKTIAAYPVTHALPLAAHTEWDPRPESARVSPGMYVCGDTQLIPGVQGALVSGRLAAECVLQDRKQ
jgi:phytoene dehydrogenase-like protein